MPISLCGPTAFGLPRTRRCQKPTSTTKRTRPASNPARLAGQGSTKTRTRATTRNTRAAYERAGHRSRRPVVGRVSRAVFQLRVYGEPATMSALAEALESLRGVRHLSILDSKVGSGASLAADVRADAADAVLAVVGQLGVPADDIVFTRLDTIGAGPETTELVALVWADMLAQARVRARASARYFVLMAAAGVVAAFAVINQSAVLIVGAMAISPDLLPITAACTGLVLMRRSLSLRGLAALAAGLTVTGLLSALVTGLLRVFDWLPSGFSLSEVPAGQTHIGASTILVAFSAGVAGMLAVETRASAAFGVAISVTTVPAASYLGVALALGEFSKSLSALWVLLANVGLMLLGGSIALAVQRAVARSQPVE